LKPDGYNQTTEVAGVTALTALERLRGTNIVRMIKPRSSSILTTGMFNLIVKDPHRFTA
jgi:hypothetical protein